MLRQVGGPLVAVPSVAVSPAGNYERDRAGLVRHNSPCSYTVEFQTELACDHQVLLLSQHWLSPLKSALLCSGQL